LLTVLASCAGDVTTSIRTDTGLRDRVMNVFTADGALAQQMTERLVATDSLRIRVVETVLHNSPSAQYVLARIGRNPDAVDLVLQAAAADSVGREHVMTLLKGMEMALKASKKH